jgi:hypothetical protein
MNFGSPTILDLSFNNEIKGDTTMNPAKLEVNEYKDLVEPSGSKSKKTKSKEPERGLKKKK